MKINPIFSHFELNNNPIIICSWLGMTWKVNNWLSDLILRVGIYYSESLDTENIMFGYSKHMFTMSEFLLISYKGKIE